ncbi:MAG: PD40 domain-containing protein, partial [Verrucomicrobiae bacterium]|nr:PD40 domain-containing protein [Verrucomicrobiae bacterium]
GRFGTPTLLIESNHITRIDAKLGYLAWHPNGKMLAFGDNKITQFFHIAGPNNRDVFDAHSDLGVLHLEDQTIEKPPAIARPDHNENWPSWAPDGRHLYFCSSPTVAFEDVAGFRYDLLRIPYDPDRNQWGEPEVLLSAAEHHLSFHQPRVSPDGRFLVLTVSEFGSFPLFRSDSDLWLLRLDTRELKPLPMLNSPHAETWHSWSSNGRWLLFGSRRVDGVFARLFITHVDPEGQFSKPVLLPQEDPEYYGTCLDNFNAPELARGPVRISEEELAKAVDDAPEKTAAASAAGSDPYRSSLNLE